jgi:hypothetical protein
MGFSELAGVDVEFQHALHANLSFDPVLLEPTVSQVVLLLIVGVSLEHPDVVRDLA